MIHSGQLSIAEYTVDKTGIVEALANGVRTDKRGRASNRHALRLLIIGLILAIDENGRATIARAHRILTEEVSLPDKIRLGIATLRIVDDAAVIDHIDISAFHNWTRNIGANLGWGHQQNPGLSDAERTRRKEVIENNNCELMALTDLGWTSTTMGVDDTKMWAWSKGRTSITRSKDSPTHSENDEPQTFGALVDYMLNGNVELEAVSDILDTLNIDPNDDAALVEWTNKANESLTANGVALRLPKPRRIGEPERTRGQRFIFVLADRDARWHTKTGKNGKRTPIYGYGVHTLVLLPGSGNPKDEPRLVRAFQVTPANADIVEPTLAMLDSLPPGSITDLVGDRLYPHKTLERFHYPLDDRNIALHFDLRSDQIGFTPDQRVLWAAGVPHCPGTPIELGEIARPSIIATNEDRAESIVEFENRQLYALQRTTRPKQDGTARWMCPAQAGKVGCPLRPETIPAAIGHRPIIENSPNPDDPRGLPNCCSGAGNVTLTPTAANRKLMQPHYWGADNWTRTYNQRSYVESVYGTIKNPNRENAKRGHHQLAGLALVNLVVALTLTVYNIKTLRAWHERTGLGPADHPLLIPTPPVEETQWRTYTREELLAFAEHLQAEDNPD